MALMVIHPMENDNECLGPFHYKLKAKLKAIWRL
jgi:hypothetical protein